MLNTKDSEHIAFWERHFYKLFGGAGTALLVAFFTHHLAYKNDDSREYPPIPDPPTTLNPLRVDEQTDAKRLKEAFGLLFESKWSKSPYTENHTYACHNYQGKWYLDDRDRYYLRFKSNSNSDTYYIYSESESVDFYAWCKHGNTEGNVLEGIEFLTNAIYYSKELLNPHSPKERGKLILIGKISGLFLDEIRIQIENECGQKEKIMRHGRRIGRYQYALNPDNSSLNEKEKKKLMNQASDFLSQITSPECETRIYNKNGSSTKPSTLGKPAESTQTVMEFQCKNDQSIDEQYYKKLTFHENPWEESADQ